ncbi:MAG: hypothetical protein HYX76_08100 [Acidobacteria bacterium]|nr:hypothetical protein [Acidobacteriota bacterium]
MKKVLLCSVLVIAGMTGGSAQQVGPNVNVAAGTEDILTGDPCLQRQNEPAIAVSTRNSDHMLAAMNDYRTVCLANDPAPEETSGAQPPPEAWLGVAFSQDRGRTWYSGLLPGSPYDTSTVGRSSPLFGHTAGSDPVLVPAPHGRFYLGGLVFDRDGISKIFVARYTDRNAVEGGETIHYDFARVVARGSQTAQGRFTDKPSIGVSAGEGSTFTASSSARRKGKTPVVPGCERVYIAYTVFEGGESDGKFRSSIWFSYSASCGDSWAPPTKISAPYEVGSTVAGIRNQGTAMAIDPATGHIYVAWRTFDPHGYVIVRSTDGGQTFSKPTPIDGGSPVRAYDQSTITVTPGPPTFRTNAYPTLLSHAGRLLAAWQERVDIDPASLGFGRPSEAGSPRVVLTMGTLSPGGTIDWTPRRAVDLGDIGLAAEGMRCEQEIPESGTVPETVCRDTGQQVMPHLAARENQLALLYYEARGAPDPVTGFASGVDRQVDARVAIFDSASLDPSTGLPMLVNTVQVSRYTIDSATGRIVGHPSAPPPHQRVSYANAPLYRGGLAPFIGDYLHLIPLRPDGSGPGFRAIWTDNRDVVFPADWNFANYTVPGTAEPACNPASRNANPYTAEVATGLVVGSRGNFKQLVNSAGDPLQRAFTVYAENHTAQDIAVEMFFGQVDSGVVVSFEQFSSVTSVKMLILANSSLARTAFLSGPATGSVRVDVRQIDPKTEAVVDGGLFASVTLNGDPTNPLVGGAEGNVGLADTETHNPQLGSPQLGSPQLGSPQLGSPQIGSPQIGSPQIGSPQIGSPQIGSAGEPTDLSLTVTNAGNTASSVNFLAGLANAPDLAASGHLFQVILFRTHWVPTASGCNLGAAPQQQVIFVSPQLGSPQLGSPQLGSPQLGSPQLGSPQLGSPQLGSALLAASAVSIAPADPSPDAHDGTIHGQLPNDAVTLAVRIIHPETEADPAAVHTPQEFLDAVAVAVQAQAANTDETVPPETIVGSPDILAAGLGLPLVVTNTNDSGPGSLRRALLEANAASGVNTIEFDIAGAAPYTITPLSALPTITDPVVIDGTTEPDFAGTPVIVLNGSAAGIGSHGLTITAGSSVIRGLVINNFSGAGIRVTTNGSNVVEGNYIGTDVTGALDQGNGSNGIHIIDAAANVIGGTAPSARNVISGNNGEGVRIDGANATGNVIEGNYIGTSASGTGALGNSLSGVYIRRAPDNFVTGNVISGNLGFAGIAICGNAVFCGGGDVGTPGNNAPLNKIRGNLVGTNAAGSAGLGNSGRGVSIDGAPSTVVGGLYPSERNIISANGLYGVVIFASGATGNLVRGNFIGTDAAGTAALGNLLDGVRIDAPNNTVGGTTLATAQNRIASNGGRGISVVSNTSTGNLLRFNRIYSNGSLGIDLGADDVTANDTGDGDSGPNDLQNFPVLTQATSDGAGGVTIQGSLNSTANTQFDIDFFHSPACDPSSHGEGQTWFATYTNASDGVGNINIIAGLGGVGVPVDSFITAVATSPANNTSEFSNCVQAVVP